MAAGRTAGAPEPYAGWRGHVIVCGLHGVGLSIVEELSLSGVPAVVVDDDPDLRLARTLLGWGVPHIPASPRSPETLAEAGLAGAAAVICALEDDLHTLETALLARELRADVRVVVQLGNPAVGRALTGIASPCWTWPGCPRRPSSRPACARRAGDRAGRGAVLRGPDRGAAGRARCGTFTGRWPRSRSLPADGGEVVVCPGRDHRVGPGDEVTLFGTAGRTARRRRDRPGRAAPTTTAVRPGRRAAPAADGAGWPEAADRRLAVAAERAVRGRCCRRPPCCDWPTAARQRRIPAVDAVYFTVETVTTVGYGDFSFRDQPPWLRRLRHRPDAGWRAVRGGVLRAADQRAGQPAHRGVAGPAAGSPGCSGHVLVIGLGSVGLTVVRAAGRRAGAAWWWSSKNEDNRHLAQLRALGVPVVIADATQPQTLALGQPRQRGRGGRADQRRPGQPGDRPGRARPARGALGARSRWCCGCSTRSWPGRSARASGSGSCGPRPRWPRRGSSARRWAWTC